MPVPSQGHYVFTVFRILTDFVCLYNYEFWLSLCKIVRSSYHIRWRKCQKYFYVTYWQKKFLTFFTSLSLYIFTIWKCITYIFFCRNACTKSVSLRFSQFPGCWLILSVYIIMSFDFPFVRLFGVRYVKNIKKSVFDCVHLKTWG
jgi:hypothetical protein